MPAVRANLIFTTEARRHGEKQREIGRSGDRVIARDRKNENPSLAANERERTRIVISGVSRSPAVTLVSMISGYLSQTTGGEVQ